MSNSCNGLSLKLSQSLKFRMKLLEIKSKANAKTLCKARRHKWDWEFGWNNFYLDKKWSFQVFDQFHAPTGKEYHFPYKSAWAQERVGRFGEEWNLLLLMGITSSDNLSITKGLYLLSYHGFLFYSSLFDYSSTHTVLYILKYYSPWFYSKFISKNLRVHLGMPVVIVLLCVCWTWCMQ